jgi:hypothetical protein
VLRDRLTAELSGLASIPALTEWTHGILVRKNQLTTPDAEAVETAFATKLDALNAETAEGPDSKAGKRDSIAGDPFSDAASKQPLGTPKAPFPATGEKDPLAPIVKAAAHSVTPFNKPLRQRDREHLKFVTAQPCLACGRTPSDAHHLKFTQKRALGRKVSDEFTVPLCRLHHRELHRHGDERIWWQQLNVDPLLSASALWAQTHLALSQTEVPTLKEIAQSASPASLRTKNCETKPNLGADIP